MYIKIARENDLNILGRYEKHIEKSELQNKINNEQIRIAEEDSIFIGWLRYGLFWDNTPFINMLYILKQYRSKKAGSNLVESWENDMKIQGYKLVMTSTLSNEEGQHFYRSLGYKDSGILILPGEPAEIIFTKNL